jgi:sec-independent protein translocase protein TatA
MFGSLGMPELVIILVIALIIFGPRKLPELGRSLGQSIREFKKGTSELRGSFDEIKDDIRIDDPLTVGRPAERAADPTSPRVPDVTSTGKIN